MCLMSYHSVQFKWKFMLIIYFYFLSYGKILKDT